MRCRFLTGAEFRKADDDRMALARSRTDGKQGASLFEITGAGVMWYAPWYHDPRDPDDVARIDKALADIKADPNARWYLSRFYWETWSRKRPPICVLCPNGREWCVDAKSSNGEGWQVTGDVPLITCAPSIVVPGYHGFLRDGVFTGDIEGRGATGAAG